MIIDVPPICKVKGCQEPCQLVSKKGDQTTYMKTCRRHNYNDLPGEQKRMETPRPRTSN
jgi:hypothetical protein